LETPLRYNPALDGLRAVAAMLVVADHSRVPGFGAGFFGVDLFFVLSGYLITRLLADEWHRYGRIDLPGFYLRRILRLTPPLLLMLIAYVALAPVLWPDFGLLSHLGDAALAGFYLSDYAQAFWQHPKFLLHTWSLAVEEHFYLIWPLAALLLTRLQWRWRVALLFGLYVLATAWRVFELERVGWSVTYYSFDTRLSGLMLGALLAIGLPALGRISDGIANAAGLFACIALVSCLKISTWEAPWALTWTMTVVELAAAAILIAASVESSWVSALLSTRPLVGIGVISYGVYLWHYPAAYFLRAHLPWFETWPLVLAFALSAATASYMIIERPLQQYRRGLTARRRSTPHGTRAAVPVAANPYS
jgi:peptidoglycan/LPS O-acetylase OafA/YrhL